MAVADRRLALVYPRVCAGERLLGLVRAGQASEGCPALCLSRANLTEGLQAAGTPVGFAAACLDYSVAALAACGIWVGVL